MIWLTWRQHRVQLITAATLLALIAVLLTPTGLDQRSPVFTSLPFFALHFVPLILGAMWGAPLLGREFEQGTQRLIWTQSVSRRRWLITKLTAFLAASVGSGLALGTLCYWWFQPLIQSGDVRRLDISVFGLIGIVPAAYTVFTFALAVASGAFLRSTVPALAVTLGGYVAAQLAYYPLRANFPPPLVRAEATSSIKSYPRDHGEVYVGGGPDGSHAFYQPDSAFWTLQVINSALLVAAAAGLLAAAGWWVLRRRC